MKLYNQYKNTSNIAYIKNKDILDKSKDRILSKNIGSTVIIPHVCNNINLFGAGFAAYIGSHYPIVKENFHMLGNKAKLGQTQFVLCETNNDYKHSIIVANMIAQNGVRTKNNIRPLNYAALVHCMCEVNSYIRDIKQKQEILKVEIHTPKFGSGLAGGDWLFIEKLIEDIWTNYPVYIYSK